MRLYSESSQETLRACEFLKHWHNDGLVGEEQYQQLKQETVSDLRTTNIFLRLVLLFFTIIAVAAIAGLFFTVIHASQSDSANGVCFLVFAVLATIAAESAAAGARLYRYGIEEAFAICSLAFLCLGMDLVFYGRTVHSAHDALFVACGAGAAFSLWLWHRFGLWYAFAAAMIFTLFLPAYWTPSHAMQRGSICAVYAAGLVCIAAIRTRHRFDYLEQGYSLAEAFLWLGIYLVLNLKLTAIDRPSDLWDSTSPAWEFAPAFYWTTWVLLWCLPPLILTRGIRLKDRFVIAVGILTTVLTLITNKPYLGWQRHTWDPMLLGLALIAVAVLLRRWLAQGEGGVRNGFTAASMSGKHKQAFGVASSVFGLIAPQSITPAPQQQSPKFESGFGGGSDGGGSSGDF